MKSINQRIKERPAIAWALFAATIIVVFLIGLLASSIVERRTEALFAYSPQTVIDPFESNNAVWGENFPKEYQSWLRTSDTTYRSKYNGNAMIDMLEIDPRLVVLWAGYGFAKDYNQGRGHAYAVEDIRETLRTGAPMNGTVSPMPNTCWTCKSPDVPRLMNERGIAEFYKGTWETLGNEVTHAIGCADCHDAKNMNLKITRPALIEAFERQGKDITGVSHQEMRSLVCAQCHVEYYFNKNVVEGVPYLTLPWDKGTSAEAILEYYDEIGFSDWTHSLSKAPMLKAQHPGYEVYLTGTHASRNVSCADCHMPYKSEGGVKFTDHHIQSPLNNVANSCQVCHREETDRLIQDVYSRQDKIIENRDRLEEHIVKAHVEAAKAWELGATEAQMKLILQGIRNAQWFWDYAAASHGSSFHSPVETGRVISKGITEAQETRLQLARLMASLGFNQEVPYPDITTKAKAQSFVGMDMEKMNKEKQEFIKSVVVGWEQ